MFKLNLETSRLKKSPVKSLIISASALFFNVANAQQVCPSPNPLNFQAIKLQMNL